ncbi:pyridoxal 5'-phosphate synthase [Streptomyces sp. NPDC049906]|uniref:pyridoxine/pyridoxamine 5'-phosphate oxidase n=1 Tax=Streptomyces sp. NPDC049906 TaxID=3155656 RepID=UPI003419E16D
MDDAPESELDALLKTLRVWDLPELPSLDPGGSPADPRALFTEWFADAVAAGQPEPHTMSLATADDRGRPDVRTVMLHGVDARGWLFASHATSRKGRQLAARPEAALGFYWPARARQVRVRGPVTVLPAREARADLARRTTGALAAALTGRQSDVLSSREELASASATAWERARSEPDAPAPTWTLYALAAREVEFFQGDARRQHVRLRYVHEQDAQGGRWRRELLWP